jgi:histone-lysine N-methyltransferase SETMAR
MEWRYSGSPHPKKIRGKKSTRKILASIFENQDGILLIDFLPKGQTANAECLIPARAVGLFEGKTPREGHQAGVVLARQCPSHRALATHKKLAYLGFHCLDHPTYSPDLDPSDYHLLLDRKKKLIGSHFLSDTEFIAAADTWLDVQCSELFEWLAKIRATG